MSDEPLRTCTGCGEAKPPTEFHAEKRRKSGLQARCKKCMNSVYKPFNENRIIRNRAHHRAAAELKARHLDEYNELVAAFREEARREAEELAAHPEARAHYGNTTPRLRTGRRASGESAADRIDVARCPDCIRHHDAGHVCANCGSVPHTAVALPDDGDIDEIAVERAVRGEPTALTPTEQREAFRIAAGKGLTDQQIAQRLSVSVRTVLRWRQSEGIESRWAV